MPLLRLLLKASFNFVILYLLLKRRLGGLGTGQILDSFARALLASLVMAVVLKFFLRDARVFSWLRLLALIGLGAAAYLIAAYAFGSRELRNFLEWISRRR